MKIVLINPTLDWEKKLFKQTVALGICYLGAILEERGDEVSIIDCRFIDVPLADAIPLDADIVGFSSMTFQFKFSLDVCREIKQKGFKGKCIFGGPHATALPEAVIKSENVDAVLYGESEESLPLYLEYLEGKIKPENLMRTYIKTATGIVHGTVDGWIKDLDTLPFPARHLYPLDKMYGNEPKHFGLITSRGCPYECTFCQPMKKRLFGPKVRRRSIRNILDELKFLITKYDAVNFAFVDDTFTFNKKYLFEFCNTKMKEGITMPWGCQTRSNLDLETLEKMRESGCEYFWIGIESGSQAVLNKMKKETFVAKNKEFLANCKKVGIASLVNMMVGFPGETEDDLEESIRFVEETQPDQVLVSQTTPFPGTYIYDNADVMALDYNNVARHVFEPKFKSMAHLQNKVIEATQKMSKVMDAFSINRFDEEEIDRWLDSIPLYKKEVFIFGTSVTAKKIYNRLRERKIHIKEFIDSFHDGEIDGTPVKRPYKPDGDYLVLISSTVHNDEMKKTLLSLDVDAARVFELN
ncbi:MAG: radical SAM protein [Nitrospinae bacterium]|nr:radical SAM protein [Nitrospinota bacterium]